MVQRSLFKSGSLKQRGFGFLNTKKTQLLRSKEKTQLLN